jgi:asparagine synthase (glutamine-hydrolysing)
MEGKLPSNIIHRPKKGFGIPLSGWLKNELKNFCNQALSREVIEAGGLFEFEYIEKLKEDHFAGREDNRKMLWTLLMFQLWYKKWM